MKGSTRVEMRGPFKSTFLIVAGWASVIVAACLVGVFLSLLEIRVKYQRLFDREFSQTLRSIEERVDRIASSAGSLEALFAASEEVTHAEYAIFCQKIMVDAPFIASICVLPSPDERGGVVYHYPSEHPSPPILTRPQALPIAWMDDSGRLAFAFRMGDGRRTVVAMESARVLSPSAPSGIALVVDLAPAEGLAGTAGLAARNAGRPSPPLGRTVRREERLSLVGRAWIVRGRSLEALAFEDAMGLAGVVVASGSFAAALLLILRRRYQLRVKEEQLRQAQRLEMVGMMAGGIAHDFNNVLSGIAGTASLMEGLLAGQGRTDAEALRKSVALVAKSTERGRDIVARLLNLVKPSPIARAPVDLWRVLEDVAELARNTCDTSVSFELPSEGRSPAFVAGDAGQIAQALLNLAINAAHAMTSMRKRGEAPGGVVEMNVSHWAVDAEFRKRHAGVGPDDAFLRITVADSGVGMDKAALDRIFSPFYSTKRSNGGSGLGLLMAQSIVASHRGHMEVESRPGKGTVVSVYFPAMKAKDAEGRWPLA